MSETITHHDSVDHICSNCGFVLSRGLTPIPCPMCGTVDLKATTTQEAFALLALSIRNLGGVFVRAARDTAHMRDTIDAFSYSMHYRLQAERRRYALAPWYERLRLDLEADTFAARHGIEYGYQRHVHRHVAADLATARAWIVNRIVRWWPDEFTHDVIVRVQLPNQSSEDEVLIATGRSANVSAPGVNVVVRLNSNARMMTIVVDPWIIGKKEEIRRRGY